MWEPVRHQRGQDGLGAQDAAWPWTCVHTSMVWAKYAYILAQRLRAGKVSLVVGFVPRVCKGLGLSPAFPRKQTVTQGFVTSVSLVIC